MAKIIYEGWVRFDLPTKPGHTFDVRVRDIIHMERAPWTGSTGVNFRKGEFITLLHIAHTDFAPIVRESPEEIYALLDHMGR